MNHVVLIGNGFDLAHKLQTSYMHFLTWYLKSVAEKVEENQFYEDDILKVFVDSNLHVFTQVFRKGQLSNSPKTIFEALKTKNYEIQFKSHFIGELFSKLNDFNWVDIEYQYFSWIKRLYIAQSSNKNSKDNFDKKLQVLNKSYTEIINQLEKYLSTIDVNNEATTNSDIHSHFAKIKEPSNTLQGENTLIINFNYTNTVNKYFDSNDNVQFIQIHGALKEEANPIIFGYGDEADNYYDDIEKLNDNEYLKFMKSFGYAKTTNYQDIVKFLNRSNYEVHIMGHSCGLSDRLLLKRIFEHTCCCKINIYYYEPNENQSDYINKYMDISRHFSIDKKEIMRERIVPKNQSLPLVKYKA